MTDKELLHDHVRVRTTAMRILIEVKKEEQDGDLFFSRWTLAAALPLGTPPFHVERVRALTLADYKHFRVCDSCREKYPAALVRSVGDGTDICQDCDA